MDYSNLAKEIIIMIGGKENVSQLVHCATRLRFVVRDKNKVQKGALKSLTGVLGVVGNGSSVQVVIGPEVDKVYEEICSLNLVDEAQGKIEKDDLKGIDRVFNIISGIFTPYIPTIMVSGIVQGLLSLGIFWGLFTAESGFYCVLKAASNGVFYFFPILLAFTAAKQFKVNPYIAVIIGLALLEPNFTSLLASGESISDFMGMPMVLLDYSSSVVPSIIGVWLYSILEHTLGKRVPKDFKIFVVPLLVLIVVVPVTVLVFGPIGIYLSNGVAALVNFLLELNGLIAGVIIGAFFGYLMVFGLHWAIMPIVFINLSTNGYDLFIPIWSMCTYAQIGIALGLIFKAKNIRNRELAISCFLTGILTGISEPIIYGFLTKYKKLNIPHILAGAIAGGFVGFLGCKQYSFAIPGILNIAGYFGKTFPMYVIGVFVSVLGAAIIVNILGFEEESTEG